MDTETKQQPDRFDLVDPFDSLYMSDGDRERLCALMARAEWIAEWLVRGMQGARAIAVEMVRAGTGLAQFTQVGNRVLARPSARAMQRTAP